MKSFKSFTQALLAAAILSVLVIGLACLLAYSQRGLVPVPVPPPAPTGPLPFDLRDEHGQPLPAEEVANAVYAAGPEDAAAEFQGWAGPEAVEALRPVTQEIPQFELMDQVPQASTTADEPKNVRLYLLARQLSQDYPDPRYQETGDCTSWGAAHAINCSQAAQIARGQFARFVRVFQPFLYGAGRVLVWRDQQGVRRLPAAGCSGGAVAIAAQQFGLLPYDTPGLPAYSGALADDWGRNGPPQQWREIAARHKVKTIARVTTLDQARDALVNGYGISIASGWGNPRKRYDRIDGRWVASRTGTWSHQMCLDAVDETAPSGRLWHVQNSWPKSSHPAPLDDSPAGGFWVRDHDVLFILAANDSYAYSDVDGFPAQDLDFRVILPRLQLTAQSLFQERRPCLPINAALQRAL